MNCKTIQFLIFLSVLCCSLWTAPSYAQSGQPKKGMIRGYVTDQEGNGVINFTVKIKELSRSNDTDNQGAFNFSGVPEGKYTISFTHLGWSGKEIEVTVQDGKESTVNCVVHASSQELKVINITGQGASYNRTTPSASLRIRQPLVEVAQNIQIISKDLLDEQMTFTTAGNISRNVSGVRTVMHQEDAGVGIYMRGFSATNLRNGMSVGGSFGPLREDMAFVERVEFVKGPAGFLMGNTQPGGFYNVVTKKPTGMNQSSVRFTMGSFDTYRAEVDLDGKLTEDGRLLFRLNAMGSSVGSHMQYTGNDLFGVAPSIKYNFSDKTSLTVEYNYSQNSFTGGFSKYAYSNDGFKSLPREFSFNDPITDPIVIKDQSAFANLKHELAKGWEFTGQLGYVRSTMEGESLLPKFNTLDSLGNFQRLLGVADAQNTAVLAQAFVNGSFRTGAVGHQLLGGLDLGRKQYYADWTNLADVGPLFNIYNPVYGKLTKADLPVYDRSRSVRERAGANINDYSFTSVFVQDELSFLENKIRLSLGLRYTSTAKVSTAANGLRVKNDAITPRVGLSYSIAKNTALYAVYDQSFQEQVGVLVGGGAADPSKGINKEIGWKGNWLDGKWSSTLAVYEVTKTNLLTLADPAVQGIMVQTGKARSRGVELDIKGEIIPQLNLMFNYAYTDAKVTEDNNPERVGINLDGTAKHISNAWLSYRLKGGAIDGLGFTLGYQYEGKRAGWPVVKTTTLPDDFFTVDAGMSYQKSRYNLSLMVNNVTNRYNYTGHFPGAWGYKYYGWRSMPPTNYRLSLTYRF